MKEIDKIISEIGNINDKMGSLIKAQKVNYVFDKMDKETQETVKSLINHLMVKREEKKLKKNEKKSWLYQLFFVYLGMIFREKTNNLIKGKISYE